MSEEKTGFITITYRLRLYNRHHDWLLLTKQIYNQAVWHYYQILVNQTSLLEQSNFLLLRCLEEQSIGTKEMRKRGEEPLWKLPDHWKLPLYFRRAAINTAIGLVRSYVTSCQRWQEKEGKNGRIPSQAAAINGSPVFYKGMYREFGESSIQLKVYNGEKWVWVVYPYTGRKIPGEGKVLSPALKIEKEAAYLHVPVELQVADIRTVAERVREEPQICAVAFPDSDCLAVAVVMSWDGACLKHYFVHGGKRRDAQRRKALERLEKSKGSRRGTKDRGKEEGRRENGAIYRKLERINGYYAHKVSREILEFCKENRIKVIVVPNYESGILSGECVFLHRNFYRWQGRAMIHKLQYKAYREGILVTTIRPYHISDCCSECGEKILRYNEGHRAGRNYYGGQLFFCPNGHRGNTALNTAKNIGRYFLKRFQKEV